MTVQLTLPSHTSIFNFVNRAHANQIRTQNVQNRAGRSEKNGKDWPNKWEGLRQNREDPTQKKREGLSQNTEGLTQKREGLTQYMGRTESK